MLKKWLKKEGLDGKYLISLIVGSAIGVWLISSVVLFTGYYNDMFMGLFGFLYSIVMITKINDFLHNIKKNGDNNNIQAWK